MLLKKLLKILSGSVQLSRTACVILKSVKASNLVFNIMKSQGRQGMFLILSSPSNSVLKSWLFDFQPCGVKSHCSYFYKIHLSDCC